MTFWDIYAPLYDRAEQANTAYGKMLKRVRDLTPEGASVFEAAAGTGAVSLAVADRAGEVLCTDISGPMLRVAGKKASNAGVKNITFSKRDIFETGERDGAFDVVIASQVLHLIDEPEKAVLEFRRVSGGMVIVTVTLLKGLRGLFARPSMGIGKLLGFAPKREFDADSFRVFLVDIGLPPCEYSVIEGNMPIAVAVWRKER